MSPCVSLNHMIHSCPSNTILLGNLIAINTIVVHQSNLPYVIFVKNMSTILYTDKIPFTKPRLPGMLNIVRSCTPLKVIY